MIKPDKPWPRRPDNTDGCWRDQDRIEVPVRGWDEQSKKPPPPAPPPLRMQGQVGVEWMPIVIIAFAVLLGFLAGLAAGR